MFISVCICPLSLSLLPLLPLCPAGGTAIRGSTSSCRSVASSGLASRLCQGQSRPACLSTRVVPGCHRPEPYTQSVTHKDRYLALPLAPVFNYLHMQPYQWKQILYKQIFDFNLLWNSLAVVSGFDDVKYVIPDVPAVQIMATGITQIISFENISD